MRFVAAIAIVVPVVVAAYVLSREPRPAPRAQVEARRAVDSLARLAPAASGDVEVVRRVWTGATRRGRLAWAAVELGDTSSSPGGEVARAAWRTGAWLVRDGEWSVRVEQDAPALTWEELEAGAIARRFAAAGALAAGEGRDAAQLAKRFRRALARFGRIRPDRQAIAVGPAGDEPAVGDSAVSAMLADWERRFGPPRLAPDGLHASAPRRLGVGWVEANLEVTPPGWGGVTLPLRFTGVYRDRGEDSWALVLAHLSVVVSGSDAPPAAPAP